MSAQRIYQWVYLGLPRVQSDEYTNVLVFMILAHTLLYNHIEYMQISLAFVLYIVLNVFYYHHARWRVGVIDEVVLRRRSWKKGRSIVAREV
jgi:hypothetical protein